VKVRASVAAALKNVNSYARTLMSPVSSKIALFIDGANLMRPPRPSARYRLQRLRRNSGPRHAACARSLHRDHEDQEYSSIRPLIDWLDYNGYTVVTKRPRNSSMPAAAQVKGQHGYRARGRCDELAEHIDRWCCSPGDGRFPSLSRRCSAAGVRVTVDLDDFQPAADDPLDEFARQADVFTDLMELQSKLAAIPPSVPAPT